MELHKHLALFLFVLSLDLSSSVSRNDFSLTRSGYAIRTQQVGRRRRGEADRQGTVVTDTQSNCCDGRVTVLNGYPSSDRAHVEFRRHSFTIKYGEFATATFRLSERESFVVRVGNLSGHSDVGYPLPSYCHLYVVVSSLADRRINIEHTVWNEREKVEDGRFSLVTHNGLSVIGFHVIAFEPLKVGTNRHSLHLVANFTTTDVPHEAVLDSGTYEVKVVRSFSVMNIDDFKNEKSISTPVYITFESGKRYFGSVIGNVSNQSWYPVEFKMYPKPIKPSHPKPTPPTKVLLLNAYPLSVETVSLELEQYAFQPVKYLNGTRGTLYLKKGDMYQIGVGDNEPKLIYYVDQVVPYVNGTCVIIVDSGYDGQVEHLMHCVNSYEKYKEGLSWIFTYNTLRKCSSQIDVIMLGAASDLVCESCCNRFFAVAHDLEYGFVMEGHVDPGDYKLKAFEAGSVHSVMLFQNLNSIVEESVIRLLPEMYVTVAAGICGNDTFPPTFFSFPTMLGHAPTGKQVRFSSITKCTKHEIMDETTVMPDNGGSVSTDRSKELSENKSKNPDRDEVQYENKYRGNTARSSPSFAPLTLFIVLTLSGTLLLLEMI